MEMKVHLHPDVFDIVSDGVKDIEVRVNDLKRRKLSVGDTLVFLKRPDEVEKIEKKVKALEYYDSFLELVDHYDMKRIYLDGYTKEMYLKEMHRFYTEEEEKEWGVVAIIFE
ncbi:MAG: ASCH domain-containing protein [Bacilli bacterium]|nr:ASCH domain-containing protein [Bacilli bacterium]